MGQRVENFLSTANLGICKGSVLLVQRLRVGTDYTWKAGHE